MVLGALYRRVPRYVERDVATSGVNVAIRTILDTFDRQGLSARRAADG